MSDFLKQKPIFDDKDLRVVADALVSYSEDLAEEVAVKPLGPAGMSMINDALEHQRRLVLAIRAYLESKK